MHSAPAQPFGTHDYQILFSPAEPPREVNIRAHAAVPLRVGDLFTVGRHDGTYDLVVETISHLAGGRWVARCSVSAPPWR